MIKDKKTIYFDDFKKLRDILYSYHISGGPLHILVDDSDAGDRHEELNVQDVHLEFCVKCVGESNDPIWLKRLMLTILSMVKQIPDVESRELFIMGQDIKICEV